MKRRKFLILTGSNTILSLGLNSCNTHHTKPVALTVSAAAVFRDVMVEVGRVYAEEKTNIFVNYNITGGGVLKKQIELGAPVDIYLPASAKPMNELQSKGFILEDSRQNFMKNEIVLISLNNFSGISSFPELLNSSVKRVALGTENIDAGIYAKEILDFFKIYDQVKPKGIFEEQDVQQILKYVESGHADVGITFLTEAKRSKKVKILAMSPVGSHAPVVSTIAIVKHSKHIAESRKFINFLRSNRAISIFEKFGFMKIK
ncbi:molybdate ABC transporter substrate-binding protein [Scytonema sp. UIC 10036]|uniref:molybdate ABC transporter substrate-binding protein n=1 Tax=Scytonema sp. UIC 10036 TaxID=2304196 RepID=UPI0012DA62E2|nr:molybdate ABC transporter substrate-binding protein [Scytonema sp. UIC 10036]MUG97419.1 molybdate ABC transporter substrate-binding protein [Scytonema sp. UIC 10036]